MQTWCGRLSQSGVLGAAEGQAQRTWQSTGQRSSAPVAWTPPSVPEAPQGGAAEPPSLMGVLKDAATAAPAPAEVEDDYDAM